MHYLFETVDLVNNPLLWGHRNRSTEHFSGYYHWHQCCEILVVHEGSGTIIVNQTTYEIRRGMLFFFQPFQLHKVNANVSEQQPYIRSKIHFDPYAFEEKLRPFTTLHHLFTRLWQGNHAEVAFELREFFPYLEKAIDIHELNVQRTFSNYSVGFDHCLLLLLQILNSLSEIVLTNQLQRPLELDPRPRGYPEQIMQWIEKHYRDDITLDDIANALHLSKFYLSRLFQRETGSSIPQYITARRIKIACRLLQTTDMSIEQIGSEVGISNSSYFIRLFKQAIGSTPLKYRKGGK